MATDTAIDDPSRLGLADRLRFLARDSVIYGGAAAFTKAFALITFPLLARHFSVEEYGTIDFFTVLASLLTIAFVFGQDTAVARFFYDDDDARRRREVISQSLVLQLLLIVALVPPAWMLAGSIAGRFIEAAEGELLLRLVLLQVPFLLLINFSQNILKWTFQRRAYLTVSVGSTTFSVAMLLLAITATDLRVAQVFYIYLASYALFGTLGLWLVRDWIRRPTSMALLREMLPFAIPYGIICVVGALVPALERTIILEVLDARHLGLFASGAKVAMLIALPIRAFQVAWGPFSLALHREPDAAVTYNWVLKGFTVGILVTVLLLTAVGEPVIRLLAGERYEGASVVVFALSLGLAAEAAGWITSLGIGLSKRSHLGLYAYAIFLVVSVGAMVWLATPLGIAGVAWGALAGYLAKTVAETWLAQRAYPLPWAYTGVAILALLTLLAGCVSQLLLVFRGAWAGGAAAAVGAVAVLLCGWWAVFDAEERGYIRRGARRLHSSLVAG